MSFIIRDCQRCGTAGVQMRAKNIVFTIQINLEIFVVCNTCNLSSIYRGVRKSSNIQDYLGLDINLENSEYGKNSFEKAPIQIHPHIPNLSDDIPQIIRDLFKQAATCYAYNLNDASGAIFRKTIDVATKYLYNHDDRLKDKTPANALRNRIKALGDLKILEFDIVELADIAALDGNDAVHEEDPYTPMEAEALQDLTLDLLDRLFVRPARMQRVKEKQINAGVRKINV